MQTCTTRFSSNASRCCSFLWKSLINFRAHRGTIFAMPVEFRITWKSITVWFCIDASLFSAVTWVKMMKLFSKQSNNGTKISYLYRLPLFNKIFCYGFRVQCLRATRYSIQCQWCGNRAHNKVRANNIGKVCYYSCYLWVYVFIYHLMWKLRCTKTFVADVIVWLRIQCQSE